MDAASRDVDTPIQFTPNQEPLNPRPILRESPGSTSGVSDDVAKQYSRFGVQKTAAMLALKIFRHSVEECEHYGTTDMKGAFGACICWLMEDANRLADFIAEKEAGGMKCH